MSVQRWEPNPVKDLNKWGSMVEKKTGTFVLFSDYAALSLEKERIRNELMRLINQRKLDEHEAKMGWPRPLMSWEIDKDKGEAK